MRFESDDLPDDLDMTRLSALMSDLSDADRSLDEPPDSVWASLRAQVADDRAASGFSTDATPPPTLRIVDTPPSVIDNAPDSSAAGPAPVGPVDVNSRRARRPWMYAAAAVAAVLVGVGGVFAIGKNTPEERLVASAELRQLEPLGSTTAKAKLVTVDGVTHLVIDAENMAPAPEGSEYELWLIDAKVTDPKSLGVVTGSEEVDVPESIDTSNYRIVDISLEPIDGDHQHSGHSLMRGELR